MTFTTLTYQGIEKSLADWGFSTAIREWNNQASDTFAGDLGNLAADAPDPFPYRAFVTLRIGRTLPTDGGYFDGAGDPLPAAGRLLPYSGGKVFFSGWRTSMVRTVSAEMEAMKYKFAGPMDFFLEQTRFRQGWVAWNGQTNIIDWRDQIALGYSPQAIVGVGVSVPGAIATNVMSIAQTIKQIISYAQYQSALDLANGPSPGWSAGVAVNVPMVGNVAGCQFASDPLSFDAATGNYILQIAPGQNITIPDYVPGTGLPGANGTSLQPNGNMLRAPVDAANSIMCADALRRMCKWIGAIGEPVLWWDYTTAVPTLHISTVDQLAALSLPFGPGGASAASPQFGSISTTIDRRDDLILPAVSFRYRVQGTINGAGYTQIIHDTAGNVNGNFTEGTGIAGKLTDLNGNALSGPIQTALGNLEGLPRVPGGTFDYEGASISQNSATINSAPLVAVDGSGVTQDPSAQASALAFWVELFPKLARVAPGTLKFANGGNPAPFLSAVDNNGDTIISTNGSITVNGVNYNYRFKDGVVVPQWMQAAPNIQASVIEATITAQFTSTQQTTPQGGGNPIATGTVPKEELTATLTLTNLGPGTYFSESTTVVAEPLPTGLAGYMFKIGSVPKYEGTYVLQETEITDACPPGNNLNLTGGLQEWSVMNATPQSISYDIMAATTRFNLGVPKHLGGGDMAERQKVLYGPRWTWLIGTNMTNAQSGSGAPTNIGQNVPKQSALPGASASQTQSHPSNVPDAEAGNYSGGVYPGVHHDATPAGVAGGNQPEPSIPPVGQSQGPCLIVGYNNVPGQPKCSHWCRISIPDAMFIEQLVNGNVNPELALVFRPIRGTSDDGNCTAGTRIMLSSQFFPDPAGGPPNLGAYKFP